MLEELMYHIPFWNRYFVMILHFGVSYFGGGGIQIARYFMVHIYLFFLFIQN